MSEVSDNSKNWITPEFFESNAKASDIRTACVPILQKLHRLLYDPSIKDNQEERDKLYAQLEQDNGKLLEMGIEPEMETGKDIKEYQKSPLVTAQYLAGQLLELTGRNIPPVPESTDSIGENTATLTENIKIVETADSSPDARDFMINQQMFIFIQDSFAIDESILTN